MINVRCENLAQTPKAQEPQDMKATRHDMHMSVLGLKLLKQVRDEEQKSTYGEAQVARENAMAQDRWGTRVRKTREAREDMRYEAHQAWVYVCYEACEAREHVGHKARVARNLADSFHNLPW